MKKFFTVALVAAVALVGSVVAPKSAEAVPAFARQVGVSCYTCHFQYMPKLNAFGREFKTGGFTQTSQELIEDEDLSIPPVANIGFIMKYRYRKYEQPTAGNPAVGTERGQLEFFDEAAIWLAGRLGENWGLAIEFPGGVVSSKIIYSNDFGGIQGGLVFYETDALGTAFSYETYNSGAVRNHRMFENRAATNIQQHLAGPANGESTGIHAFAASDLFMVNLGLFGPASLPGGWAAIDTNLELSQYARLALTPKLAEGLDFMIGLQIAAGQTRLGSVANGINIAPWDPLASGLATVKTSSTAIDFQIQMDDFNGMSLEVYGAYQVNPNNASGSNFYNTDTQDDASGFSLGAGLGITHAFGVKVAYLTADIPNAGLAVGTSSRSATTVGMWYDFAQNVAFVAEYSSWSGGARTSNNQLYLMLEIGF